MNNARSLLAGGIMGILSTLVGLSAAKADCSQDLHTVHELNVYRAEDLCDIAVQGWIEDNGLTEAEIDGPHGYDGMWEACMRLATPVTVLPPEQHYDTTDGAFWRIGGGL